MTTVTRRATTREELIADMPREWTTQLVRDRVADALVPTVDAMIAAAVAEALELAAVLTVPSQDTAEEVREALLRRADALRAEESA